MKIKKTWFSLEIEITPEELDKFGGVISQTYSHAILDYIITILAKLTK